MRIPLATRPATLAAALFVVALIALLPLRLVLGIAGIGDEGLAARRVEGSVWRGRLVDAGIGAGGGAAPLGDLDARLSPLALLAGRARLALDSRDDAPGRTVHGAVLSSRHALGIEGMSASVGVGRLLAPLPVATLDLDGVTVRFRDEACEAAEGRVRVALASGGFGGVALPASLAGSPRCDGPALLVPLASLGGGERVQMRITSDGRYHADFTLQPPDDATAQRLAAAGFVAGAGGWRLSVEGRL